MTQPPSHPSQISDQTAKIYAPLLVKLESEYPEVAKCLTGIGDAPVTWDVSKTEVKAYFETEAGTRFHAAYHTTAATSADDAAAFLAKVVQKYNAVTASDAKVLGAKPVSQPAPVTQPSAPVAPVEEEDDDPEPAPPPEDADADEDWGKESSGTP